MAIPLDKGGMDFSESRGLQGHPMKFKLPGILAVAVLATALSHQRASAVTYSYVGNDYTIAGRISGATGVPAILGWLGHEDQWREGKCKPCAGRFEDVNNLYKSTDPSAIGTFNSRARA